MQHWETGHWGIVKQHWDKDEDLLLFPLSHPVGIIMGLLVMMGGSGIYRSSLPQICGAQV